MKKILLCLVAGLGLAVSSNAQILTQDFESATVPGMPAGWDNHYEAAPGWQTGTNAGSSWGALILLYNMPAHTTYAYVDDQVATADSNFHDTLMSPVFDMTGTTDVWVNYAYFFYKVAVTATGVTERCFIIGSSNGGSTWTVIDSVDRWLNNSWNTEHAHLTPTLSGANCRIAFVFTDGGSNLLGIGIDDIVIADINKDAVGVTAIDYNSAKTGVSMNGETVSFTVENRGNTISSFDAYYTINGSAPIVQSFTGLNITLFAKQTFSFTVPIGGAVATNTIRVGVPTVNTVANPDPDSARNSDFVLASAAVQRQGLIEEFTSSTCAPCKVFNASYDPLCTTLNMNTAGTDINIVKYQMNAPAPGNDRSYNADGRIRSLYYYASSIPRHYVNGVVSTLSFSSPFTGAQTTNFTNQANGSKSKKAHMDMTAAYTVDTVQKNLYVTLTVTPHFTRTGTYHVYIACMDKSYQNTTNTEGQLKYQHVMRKMVPSGTGRPVTSWTDGVPQTFTDTVAYTNGDWTLGVAGYPVQGSYTFWNSPLAGEMVAFVEEDATKTIMQSFHALPVLFNPVSVSTLSKVNEISLFPNPANDNAVLKFNLLEAGAVQVYIADISGRIVKNVINENRSLGAQNVTISTEGLAAGEYLVLISTKGGNNIARLSITK